MAIGMIVASATVVASPAYAATPSNDDIAQAIVVAGLPYTDTVDTSTATYASGDSGCGAATVWYTFRPGSDGSYAFTTVGSDYDTTLAVLTGAPGSLSLVACNDDALGLQSALKLDLTAGTTYYVEAGTCCGGDIGQVGPGGNLVVNVDVAPPAFDVEVTVDRGKLGGVPGTAVVSGTVTCNLNGFVDIYGTLRQKQGLNIARGDFSTNVACSTTPTTWTATVDATSRVLLPKLATVTAFAFGCDPFTCDGDTFTGTVKLTR